MKHLLRAVSIIILAAIGAGGVLYAYDNCPKRKEELNNQINIAITKYIEKNPQYIFEHIAKTENFNSTVKNIAGISDQEFQEKIQSYLKDTEQKALISSEEEQKNDSNEKDRKSVV